MEDAKENVDVDIEVQLALMCGCMTFYGHVN